MKSILLLFTLFVANITLASVYYEADSIAPPPLLPAEISGDSISCVGDTSNYTADIPVTCEANWYINGEQQSSTSGELEIIWTEPGIFIITLDINCDTITYSAGSLEVTVHDIPEIPEPITGQTEVCINSTITYTTVVDSNETCQWNVDGVTQLSDSATMAYYWDEVGVHVIEVRAINDCGMGEPTNIDVTVFDLPVVDLGNDTTIIIGNSLLLDAGNPGSVYFWSTGETTQTIFVNQSGGYDVLVSNACGDASDTIVVDVIVGFNNTEKQNNLTIVVSGSNIFVLTHDIKARYVEIWDVNGRFIMKSDYKESYPFHSKGTFVIRVITYDGSVYNHKFIVQ